MPLELLPRRDKSFIRRTRAILLFFVVSLIVTSFAYLPQSPLSNIEKAKAVDTTVFILNGTTSWQVPSDWSDVNTIHVIGGGAAGNDGGASGSGGGGAGAYSTVSNVTGLTGGNNLTVQVGAGGTTDAQSGTVSWFNGNDCGSSSVCAMGGNGTTGTTGGAGGNATGGVGTQAAGGAGGNGLSNGDTGGGGGGAAGPNGAGKNGGSAVAGGGSGGGGGGGADGASSTVGANGTTSIGGNGGAGPGGNGIGTGGNASSGNAGANGGGGGGADTGSGLTGGNGGAGAVRWTQTSNSATAGSGGGGGGGGNTGNGGRAGLYGGGGGGAEGVHGNGANGIIVVVYTPTVAITVSGTIFSDGGSTRYDCNADNVTVAVRVGGSGTASGTCSSAVGAYSVSVTGVSANSILTVYVDGEDDGTPYKGVTVTKAANGTSNIDSVYLYKDRVIIKNETTGSITNANLSTADSGDADIVYAVASSNLTVDSNISLLVWPGDTYDPGGTVTTQGTGDFTVSTSSVAYLDTASNTIAGDVIVDNNPSTCACGGTLYFDADTTVNGGAISATGTANLLYSGGTTPTVTLSGTGTVADNGSATSTFYNFTTSGSGTTTFGSDIKISNDLTVGSGTTLNNNGPHSITVSGGDATGDGTITLVGGTFTLTGTGSLGGASAWTFASTTIGNATLASTTLTGSITSTSTLTIGSSSYLFGSTKTIVLSTSTSPFTINGDFEPGLSTLSYRGTASQTITATSTYSIDFSPTSLSPTYTISPPSLWYDKYSYRKTITIDATKVTSDFTDFPTLISLADTDLAANAQADGDDIAFYNSSGTQLDHDLELYSSGGLSAWVQANLASTTDTVIYMAYGNSSLTAQENPTGAWDTDYKGVWHLGDGDSTAANFYQDSTTGNSDGTLTDTDGDVTQTNGKIGKAMNFNTGDLDFITTADTAEGASTITVSAWFKRAISTDYHGIVSHTNGGGTNGWWMTQQINQTYPAVAFGGIDFTGSAAFPTTQWHYITVTFNTTSNVLRFYANGSLNSSQSTATNITESADALRIGSEDGVAPFNGVLDEIRVSGSVRSEQWIQTEYNNQSATSTFYQVGSATPASAGTLTANGNFTLGGAGNVTVDANTDDPTIDIGGDFTVGASDVFLQSNTASTTIAGSFTNSGTFTHNGAITWFDANATGKTISGGSFDHVTFNNSNGGWTWSGSNTIAGNLTITSGAVTGSTGTVTIGGNFSLNGGSFTHNSGTIAFASTTPHTITGSVTFYNFTDTTASSSIRFDDNDSYTFSIAAGGTWTLTGTQGAPVEIRSDSAGSQFTMDFQGSVAFTNVTVKDAGCHASSDTIVVTDDSIHNEGNNGSCWVFVARGNPGVSHGSSGGGQGQSGASSHGGGGVGSENGAGNGQGQSGGSSQDGGGATP